MTRSVRVGAPSFLARLFGSGDPDTEHETALVLGDDAIGVAWRDGCEARPDGGAGLELLTLPRSQASSTVHT